MWKRFLSVGTVTIAVLALSLATAGASKAASGDMKYGYHLGDDFLGCAGVLPTDPPIVVDPDDPTCRPEAVAEDFAGAFPGMGGSIAIQGEGELTVSEKGKPKKVSGGGLFALFDESGILLSSGTWKARKLLSFDAYGEDDLTPLDFEDVSSSFRVAQSEVWKLIELIENHKEASDVGSEHKDGDPRAA